MRNFHLKEFACPCCGKVFMYDGFLAMLDRARGMAETPFVITSGYRCHEHNKDIGGSPTSSHRKGCAVDIAAPDSASREKILRGLILAGFRRIGIGKDFIHVDSDAAKPNAVWTYYK